MEDFTSFDYKLYRKNLASNLKLEKKYNGDMGKEYLNREKHTLKYQVAKNIKVSVCNELRSILAISDSLKSIKDKNEYLDELNLLIEKVKNDHAIIYEIEDAIRFNKYFNLKLIESDFYHFIKFIPKELLKSKEFILEALNVDTRIIRYIPSNEVIFDDLDIISFVATNNFAYLIYFDIIKYKYFLIKKFPKVKIKFNSLLEARRLRTETNTL